MHPSMTLEKRIKAEIAGYDGKMSVYVDDLKGNIIQIGEKEVFETASTIKTYILAALFASAERGEADLEEQIEYKKEHYVVGSGVLQTLSIGTKLKVKDVAMLMISISDNIATNMMIDYLGLKRINRYIQEMGCYDTVLYNPIDFDKYDRLGATTTKDYASMFVRLARSELVSEEASRQMLDIFRKQHYNSMLTRYFPPFYLDSEDIGEEELIYVASKSGCMDACRNDGGIVHTPYGDYVIVIMNKEFSDWIYHDDHPAYLYGARVSRLILDQYLALEGRLIL